MVGDISGIALVVTVALWLEKNAITPDKTLVCQSVNENTREHILFGSRDKSSVLQGTQACQRARMLLLTRRVYKKKVKIFECGGSHLSIQQELQGFSLGNR